MADSTQKRTVIVLGGAGFIGSHLCESLLDDARVICIDNLSSSTSANIEQLLAHPDFVFIKHDITEPLDLSTLPVYERFKMSVHGVSEIYHLACPMSVRNFRAMRVPILDAHSVGIKNMLMLAMQYKAKVIFASSSTVYGQRYSDVAVKESDVGITNHLQSRAAYDESKRFAETMLTIYADTFGVDVRIARLFRTYGPRLKMFDDQMITEFVLSAMDGEPMKIYGTENFRTSLLYVTDAVSALIKLAKVPAGVGPVNIGGDEEFYMKDVAARVNKLLGTTVPILYEQPLEFLSEHPMPDITYAKEAIGWMPLMRLDNGLQRMIDYVTANRHRLAYEGG